MSNTLSDRITGKLTNRDGQLISSPEARAMGRYFCERADAARESIMYCEREWEQIADAYESGPRVGRGPRMVAPIVNPTIEGQLALIAAAQPAFKVRTLSPSDAAHAEALERAAAYIAHRSELKTHVKDAARRYLLYGTGVFALGFDQSAGTHGLPAWRTPRPSSVLVDSRVRDIKDVQQAEYIIEDMGEFLPDYAAAQYGDEAAAMLARGDEAFRLLHVWTRRNPQGNLQLIEMDGQGRVLRWSDPERPYYAYVGNRYPYSFFRLYPEEGQFYGFGDGRLLCGTQRILNSLYDEMVTAVKFQAQTRTFIDPAALVDPDEFDSDPSHPIMAHDPKNNIVFMQGGGINPVVFSMIEHLLTQAQRITRFDSVLSGGAPTANATATQIAVQVSGGAAGIADKRADIEHALGFGMDYALGLALEFYSSGIYVDDTTQESGVRYIDFRGMRSLQPLLPDDEGAERPAVTADGSPYVRPVGFEVTASLG